MSAAERTRKVTRRQALQITAVAGVGLAFAGELTSAVLKRAGLHRIGETRTQMGTQVTVTVLHPDPSAAQQMVQGTFAEVERLEAILSRHRPDTPLSRLHRDGHLADAPAELVEVLGRALDYSSLTGGAFDVTVAPLLDLYQTLWWSAALPPIQSEMEKALALVDYRQIQIQGRAVSLLRPGMAITLDGIAKGYVVDHAVRTLRSAGADRVMVEAGGDLGTSGSVSDGEGWQVAIQDPHDARGSLGVLHLRGESVSTSGDYMQAFTQDRGLNHILDPKTGRSPVHTSAVTVVAPTSMDADALSTSAFVLGPSEGLALLEKLDGVEGLIVTKEGEELATRGFSRTS
ncbi:MAG: FAD:protein FMN transferase [Gemmatimonadetes bacterium]|nr:FAD:protein FMN transferase [Gemmatimonadota bacterium]